MDQFVTEASAPIDPLTNPERLDALRESGLVDAEIEASFDRAVRHASRVLDAKVSLLSLVTDERQFFKAQVGLPEPTATERQTPLSHSFCQHVVRTGDPFVVEDAREHPLVKDNLAIPDLNVIAYLGVPVVTADGHVLGSFCAIQDSPRAWTDEDRQVLEDVAAGVISEINLRLALQRSQRAEEALGAALSEKDVLLREVNHRVKNLFSLVPAIVQMTARAGGDTDTVVAGIKSRVEALSRSHALMINAFSEDRGVSLDALVRAVLEPYASRSDAFVIDGPAVRLRSSDSNAMGLALHELATNAAKYGALLAPRGSVVIRWRIVEASDDADGKKRRLVLHWTETGGPDASCPPERNGFGTRLIDRLFALQKGAIERDWQEEGLAVAIDLPLHDKKGMSG